MKITKLELKNFKRFDDLTIDMTALDEAPKLVLLIGTNGSGKSSVFDSFEYINIMSRGNSTSQDHSYYVKNTETHYEITLYGNFKNVQGKSLNKISSFDGFQNLPNLFYGRTSIRQVPVLTR